MAARLPGAAIAALTVLACGHEATFSTPPHGSRQPLAPANPARLTYNPANDGQAAWLPDGSGLVYAATRLDRRSDVCLHVLPAEGGSATNILCSKSEFEGDTINRFEHPAVSANGEVAYWRVGIPRRLGNINSNEIAAGRLDTLPTPRRIGLPRLLEFGFVVRIVAIRWLGDTIQFDSDSAGSYLLPPGATTPVAVTRQRPFVGVEAGGLLYLSDDRLTLLRLDVATGDTTVVRAFSSQIRNVSVAANRLAYVEADSSLFVVEPATGTAPQWLGRPFVQPALSPDGRRLIAESAGDLWLFVLD